MLDGIKIGRIRRNESYRSSTRFDQLANTLRLVRTEPIHYYDVAGLQPWRKMGSNKLAKNGGAGPSFDSKKCFDPIDRQSSNQCQYAAPVPRHDSRCTLAARRPCVRARHGNVRASLIHGNQAFRRDLAYFSAKSPALRLDPRRLSLGGADRLLLSRQTQSAQLAPNGGDAELDSEGGLEGLSELVSCRVGLGVDKIAERVERRSRYPPRLPSGMRFRAHVARLAVSSNQALDCRPRNKELVGTLLVRAPCPPGGDYPGTKIVGERSGHTHNGALFTQNSNIPAHVPSNRVASCVNANDLRCQTARGLARPSNNMLLIALMAAISPLSAQRSNHFAAFCIPRYRPRCARRFPLAAACLKAMPRSLRRSRRATPRTLPPPRAG